MTNSIRPLPAYLDAQYDYTIKISGLNVFMSALSADERATLTRIGAIINTNSPEDDNLSGMYLYIHLTMLPMSMYSNIDNTASEIMTTVSTLLLHTTGVDIARSIDIERASDVHEDASQIKYLLRIKEGHDNARTRLILSIMSHFTIYVQQTLKKMQLHMPRLPYETASEFISAMNADNDQDPVLVDHMHDLLQDNNSTRRQQCGNNNNNADATNEIVESPASPSSPLSHAEFNPLHDENSEAYSDDYITHIDISDLLEGADQVSDELAAPQDGDENASVTFRSIHSEGDLVNMDSASHDGSLDMTGSHAANDNDNHNDFTMELDASEDEKYFREEQVTVADVHQVPVTSPRARDRRSETDNIAQDEFLVEHDDDVDLFGEIDEIENERLHVSTESLDTEYATQNIQPLPTMSSTVTSVSMGKALFGTDATEDGTEVADDAILGDVVDDYEIENAAEAVEESIARVARENEGPQQRREIVPADLLEAFPLPSIDNSTSAAIAAYPTMMVQTQRASDDKDAREQTNGYTIPSAAHIIGANREPVSVNTQEKYETSSNPVPFVSIIPTATDTVVVSRRSSQAVDGSKSQRKFRQLYKTPIKTDLKKKKHTKELLEEKEERVQKKITKRSQHKKEKHKRRAAFANDDSMLTATEQERIKAKAEKKAKKIARRLAKAVAKKQEDMDANNALITTTVDKSNDNTVSLATATTALDQGSISTTADLRERMGISLALNRDTDAASASTTADLRDRMGTALTISSTGTNRRRKSDDPPEIDDLEAKVARQSEGITPWEQNVLDEKWNQLLRRMPGAGRMEDENDDNDNVF